MATLSNFSFSVFGQTADEVTQKLDELCNERILAEGGEPWLVTIDKTEKICIARDILDPTAWVYIGKREVTFAGPSLIDSVGDHFGDGFRPQSRDDEPMF